MMSQLNTGAQHGMIGFNGVRELQNRDWLMQVPFVMLNAGERHGGGADRGAGCDTAGRRLQGSASRSVLQRA